MFGLQPLIAPLTVDEFLDDPYERSARHIPGSADKFEGLFGWEDLNTIINDRLAGHTKVKLVLEKRPLAPETLERIDFWLREASSSRQTWPADSSRRVAAQAHRQRASVRL